MSHSTSTPKEWGKLTVAELKEELQARDLPTTGKKIDLVLRLRASKEETVALLDDKEDVENTLIAKDDISQLDEDMEMITQDEYRNEDDTNEETAFVTAVDESGNLSQDFEEMEETMQKDINESASQAEKDSTNLVKERDDALSKADSLTVNLDQDIASLGDLEENKGVADPAMETTEGEVKDGVLIDAVGEVDDEEFGAVVANMDDSTAGEEANVEVKVPKESNDEEEKVAKEKENAEEEKKVEKVLPRIPAMPMNHWLVRQFATAKRFSSLYIRPLSAKDVLCAAIVEWANRAAYFCINHERDGKGVVVLNFITEKECKEAKESLTESLGENIKVIHPHRQMEESIKQAASYKVECPNLVTRTLVLEDAPPDTTEDQVCLLFPGAISVSRPDDSKLVCEWQNQRYSLPESASKIFLIEFGFPKAATRVLAEEYELNGEKVKLMSLLQYQKNYREYFNKKQEEDRIKRREQQEKERRERDKKSKEQVFSDQERIELCKALREIVNKRGCVLKRTDVTWNEKLMQKEKLTSKLMDIVRALDADSDKRVKLGLGFPEAESLMTRNTRKMYQRNPKLRRPKERHRDKKSDTKKVSKDTVSKKQAETPKAEEKPKEEEEEKGSEKVEETETGSKKASAAAASDDIIVVGEVAKPVEEIEIKDDEDEEQADSSAVRENPVTGGTEEKLVEGQDMEMAEENPSDNKKQEAGEDGDMDQTEEDIIAEVVGEVFASTTEEVKKSKHTPKKEKEENKGSKKDGQKGEKRERKTSFGNRDSERIRQELSKLEEDKRGWWSISQERQNPKLDRNDYQKIFKKFGKVMEVHITGEKVFIRFNSRSGASAAVRELWGTKRNIAVPPVLGVWQKDTGSLDARIRGRAENQLKDRKRDRKQEGGSRFERRGGSGGRGNNEIPSLLSSNNNSAPFQQHNANPLAMQLQQQVQQQMMMQQQLQQQQQMALLQLQQQQQQQQKQQFQSKLADGLLGAGPQPLLSGGDMRNSGRSGGGSSGGSIPSLFGATGVPPVRRNNSPDRGFRRRRSLSPDRGRGGRNSPQRKVIMSSGFDSKRPRLDDNYGFQSNESHGYQVDTDSNLAPLSTATGTNPNPVRDMLKGLSQVISHKMDEITRFPAAGEYAVNDVMQSIGSMQKNLHPLPTRSMQSTNAFNSQLGGGSGSSYGNNTLSQMSSSRGLGGGSILGDSSALRSSGASQYPSQLGGSSSSGMGMGSSGGGYGNSQSMYSKFSGSSVGGSSSLSGRSSQVLDYGHASRKMDSNY